MKYFGYETTNFFKKSYQKQTFKKSYQKQTFLEKFNILYFFIKKFNIIK